ncbi:MAG: ATP-binding cassette domain-containing protein [Defluviitaleaceae bacterium]|nr:ATP-binding cassette domain-containing protein [Defluviitaleaceae bacterium]
MPQIFLHGITKTFKVYERKKRGIITGAFFRNAKTVTALDGVGFEMDEGEMAGYIGPNGAGKSTTVKVISGILTPEAGECVIMGRVPWKRRAEHVAQIGVVFGQRSQLWWDVPAGDSFEMMRHIYNVPFESFKQRLAELTDVLDAGGLVKTPVRQLSLGQRMRCEIVASLLHRPKILFLDEPTIGLDAVSKLALREFLKNENKKHGTTMILTTHDMDDIKALCSRVLVIGRGKILYDGAMPELAKRYAPLRRLRASAKSAPAEGEIMIDGASSANFENGTLTVMFDPEKLKAHELVMRVSEKYSLNDIMIEEQNIDEIIAEMYREMNI